ncbi:OsmC family protein [Dokdonella sp.]|uniref:OsmC family protein n=1 Tax=Dokdonella sp. TaxID=2291710 RepID=UPI0035280C3A
MSDTEEIRLTLTQESDYAFRIAFDETSLDDLHTDEPSPLGADSGPNPSRLLVAAVANCLSASLVFALGKYKNSVNGVVTRATARMARNEQKRLRIAHIDVAIKLPDAAADYAQIDRLLEQFENFCIVTESVRSGVPVDVSVHDATGAVLHDSSAEAAETQDPP